MFIGAIESEFRRWFRLNAEVFRDRTLFVGCSGNFTIEQLLGDMAGAVHSNDVSIYTHFLGHHLAGQDMPVQVKDPQFAWLQPYLDRNAGAAIVLLFELMKWNPEKNIFSSRVYHAIRDNWDANFDKTVERVEKAKATCRITTFRSSDIWDFVDEAAGLDPRGVFLAFLPFYKGGYEKLYQRLEAILTWQPPRYEIIDAPRKALLIERIKSFDYVFIDDVEYPAEKAVMLKRKTATKRMLLYSNMAVKHVLVQPHTRSRPTYYPQLTAEDLPAITPASAIVIKRVKSDEINYYRNRYLAKGIVFCDGSWSFLFFIDGKLFGFAIATLSKFGGSGLYLLSDFAIPLEDARLSKLLLLLLQGVHFRAVVEELVLASVPSLYTTAFTERAVSMKYRGVWKLEKRGVGEDGKKFLNYSTQTGLHTDSEAIEKWIKSKKPKSAKKSKS